MMEKLHGKSWGVLIMAVMFATAVSAQDLASLERISTNSDIQSGKTLQSNTENFQERKVTGTVISGDNEEGLPGVNVVVKGTTTGGITDIEGKYSVTVTDDNASLIFSSVGYVTEEVVVGVQSIIDLTLMPDVTALDEIVVIGYGTQQKRDLTGAVVSVDMTGKTIAPNTNFAQALQGYMPGVNVGIASGAGDTPGINIRGRTSLSGSDDPLIVLDGISYNGGLADININDVQSIDILKDASAAAVYGSRSANGVILITTKLGKTNKPQLRLNVYGGFQDLSPTDGTNI